MKKIVISSVGKALDYYQTIERLIEDNTPNVYLVIHSSDTPLEKIKDIEEKQKNVKFWYFNLGSKEEVENVNTILKKIDHQKLDEKRTIFDYLMDECFDQVIVDFTGGTKAMSTAIFTYFNLYINSSKLKLCYVGGERDNRGVVVIPQPLNLDTNYLRYRIRLREFVNLINKKKDYRQGREILSLVKKYLKNIEEFKLLSDLIDYYYFFINGDFGSWKSLKHEDDRRRFYQLVDKRKFDLMSQVVNQYFDLREKNERVRLSFECLFFYDRMRIACFQGIFEQALAFFNNFYEKYLYLLGKRAYGDKFIVRIDKPPLFNDQEMRDKNEFAKKVMASLSQSAMINLWQNIDYLIKSRNQSIFGHGFFVPNEAIAQKCLAVSWHLIKDGFLKTIFADSFQIFLRDDIKVEDLLFYYFEVRNEYLLRF